MDTPNDVAKLVLNLYDSLDKKGKPECGKEWTILSGFVVELNNSLKVVSLATGTKCLGSSLICQQGTTLNDSHAETLARRGLIKYLFGQVQKMKSSGGSLVFSRISDNKCVFNDGLKLHFYTSELPCGDASIIHPVEKVGEKRKLPCDLEETKRLKTSLHRTGAKIVQNSEDYDFQKKGAVRTKPGRGDPTLSLSCSDKIMRWIYTGVQGALISHLVEGDLRLDSIIIGAGSQFDENILKQSFVERSGCHFLPNFYQTHHTFRDSEKASQAAKPCPKSVIWALNDDISKQMEVSVDGRRLGVVKKNHLKTYPTVTKRQFFKELILIDEKFAQMSYGEAKKCAIHYKELSDEFKAKIGTWAEDKSQYQNFKI